MLPTRLNLLPPDKKKLLHRMIYFQFTKNTLETALFILCIIGIALLGCRWVLQNYTAELSAKITTASSRNVETDRKIKNINQSLLQLEEIQQNYNLWTPTMAEITKGVPPGVNLINLSIDFNNQSITFAGQADTREALLKLQEQLKTLEIISDIQIPLSILTEKKDIPFSISTKLNLE